VSVPRSSVTSARRSPEFVRIVARVAAGEAAEHASAEAFEAGAGGIEERPGDAPGRTELVIYAPLAAADTIVDRLGAALGDAITLGTPVPEPEVDWSVAWRDGLAAVDVSSRLRVRPPFVAAEPRPGRSEIVIEPGQAFGTGGHASTRLALELVDVAAQAQRAGTRVLDVGTGSGVLALAALGLGATWAVAHDLDPLAAPAARDNARTNALAGRLAVFTGPVDALGGPPFDAVLANLLRTELVPILPAVASRVAPDGRLILAGLLESDVAEVEGRLAAFGFVRASARRIEDADGEVWVGLLMRRRAGASSRRGDA